MTEKLAFILVFCCKFCTTLEYNYLFSIIWNLRVRGHNDNERKASGTECLKRLHANGMDIRNCVCVA